MADIRPEPTKPRSGSSATKSHAGNGVLPFSVEHLNAVDEKKSKIAADKALKKAAEALKRIQAANSLRHKVQDEIVADYEIANKVAISRLPLPVACFLCCCCWTAEGLREMLTSDQTIEFALGVIVGDAFGTLIGTLVSSLITPAFDTIKAILGGHSLEIKSGHGWVCVDTYGNQTLEYHSADVATDEGCITYNYKQFTDAIISFLLVMICAFWMVKFLRANKVKHKESKRKMTKACPMCLAMISRSSIRCRHCTTWLRPPPEPTLVYKAWEQTNSQAPKAAQPTPDVVADIDLQSKKTKQNSAEVSREPSATTSSADQISHDSAQKAVNFCTGPISTDLT